MSSSNVEEPYVKEPRPTWVQQLIAWLAGATFILFLACDVYFRFTSGVRAIDPLFDYVFVKHQAVSLPLTIVGLIAALVVDRVRAKRDPKLGMTMFWKLYAVIVLAIAIYVAIWDLFLLR